MHKTVVRVNVREGMTEPATSGSVGRSLGALFDLVVVLGRSGFCSKAVFGEGQIPLRSLRRSLLSRCGEHSDQTLAVHCPDHRHTSFEIKEQLRKFTPYIITKFGCLGSENSAL